MKDLRKFIKTTIREFLNENQTHIDNIFDAGYKVYFKYESNRDKHFKDL